MRFKSIFWLFNIVVVLALVIFAVSSFFVFGKDYAAVYWGNMWIVLVLFFVLIATLDVYFINNWKLFELLEKEDWPALRTWLDRRIFEKGRLNRIYGGLMINASLVNTDMPAGERMASISRLENRVREKKPSLLKPLGVSLGIPVLMPVLEKGLSPGLGSLSEDERKNIASYFGPMAEDRRTAGQEWASFWTALSSGADLKPLLESRDLSVRILSADLLSVSGSADEESLKALAGEVSGGNGEKKLRDSREQHIMAMVLAPTVNAAVERLEKNV